VFMVAVGGTDWWWLWWWLVVSVFVVFVVLVGCICGGGGGWCLGIRGLCYVFFKIYAYINCNVSFSVVYR